MLLGLVVAAALVVGVPWPVVGLAIAASWRPWLVLVAATAWAIWAAYRRRTARESTPDQEVAFCAAVAAELRAGASLRMALVDAAARVPQLDLAAPTRRARAGLPIDDVAAPLGDALPLNGKLAAAALRIAADTGGKAASVFDGLAARAAFAAELAREQRAVTAQARLSALVVGGAPLLFGMLLLATGRAGTLLEHGGIGIGIAVVGFALEAAGIAAVALVLRRAW